MKHFSRIFTVSAFVSAALLCQSCIFGKEAPKSYGTESKTYKSQKKDLDKKRSSKKVKRQNRESRYVVPVD